MDLLVWANLTKFSSSCPFQEMVLRWVSGATQKNITDTVLKFNPSFRNVKMEAQESELKIKIKGTGSGACDHVVILRAVFPSN